MTQSTVYVWKLEKELEEATARLAAAAHEVELERESHVECSKRLAAAEADLANAYRREHELEEDILRLKDHLDPAERVVFVARGIVDVELGHAVKAFDAIKRMKR